jgi:hypothetical protein
MASSFKNAGMSVVTTDDASANLYTASGVTAVVHAVYISNKSSSNEANVDVKVTTDGGSTFYHIGKSLRIPVENTLVLDKPINLETNDILRVVAEVNADSSSPDIEVYASVLEIS